MNGITVIDVNLTSQEYLMPWVMFYFNMMRITLYYIYHKSVHLVVNIKELNFNFSLMDFIVYCGYNLS